MIERTADARWDGNFARGKGQVRLGSGALDAEYSFGTRFGGEQGTNPEELIGGAHAACFNMALSVMLSEARTPPAHLQTRARVAIEKEESGFRITRIHLDTEGEVPGIDAVAFRRFAEDAKANCPVSRALSGVEITLEATLRPSEFRQAEPGML